MNIEGLIDKYGPPAIGATIDSVHSALYFYIRINAFVLLANVLFDLLFSAIIVTTCVRLCVKWARTLDGDEAGGAIAGTIIISIAAVIGTFIFGWVVPEAIVRVLTPDYGIIGAILNKTK